jgi:hypothetical protein
MADRIRVLTEGRRARAAQQPRRRYATREWVAGAVYSRRACDESPEPMPEKPSRVALVALLSFGVGWAVVYASAQLLSFAAPELRASMARWVADSRVSWELARALVYAPVVGVGAAVIAAVGRQSPLPSALVAASGATVALVLPILLHRLPLSVLGEVAVQALFFVVLLPVAVLLFARWRSGDSRRSR